jgi:microcystin-dependent protein
MAGVFSRSFSRTIHYPNPINTLRGVVNDHDYSFRTDQAFAIKTTPDISAGFVLTVSGNVRITGDMRIEGSVTQINLSEYNAESLTIENDGSGPAIYVNQSGANDIIQFEDDKRTVMIIKDGGNVGIGRSAPQFSLDVSGIANGDRIYEAGFPLVPTGTVVSYIAGTSPSGWLLCDGTAVSRGVFARLFSVIGTIYGVGDGINTFNLPDMRGRTAIGAGTGAGLTARTLGQTGGAETHTLSVTEIPSHTHSYVDTYRTGNQSTDNVFGSETAANETTINESKTTGATGGGGAHNNMQPFVVLNYIIKY